MKDIVWKDGYIEIPTPKNPKKITGTKFAALLGYNKWQTPFKTWCEITRLYDDPIEDNKYLVAGRTIEPKQQEYMKTAYAMYNLITPKDIYGVNDVNLFAKTGGDFFPQHTVFGGMWDSLLVDENGKPTTVIEFKTTSRPEDWVNDVPDYYALQASLYAYLLGVEDVIMVCSLLMDSDYDEPDKFVPTIENTIYRRFKVHERYPEFDNFISKARGMYEYLETSPFFDEEKDKDILKVLRTESITPDTTAEAVLAEMAELKAKLDEYAEQTKPLEKAYKNCQDKIKALAMKEFNPNVNSVVMASKSLTVSVDKSVRADVDKNKLKEDGLLDLYTVNKEIYTLRVKEDK